MTLSVAQKQMVEQIVKDNSKGNEEADTYYRIVVSQMIEIDELKATIERMKTPEQKQAEADYASYMAKWGA